jgi:hypothetical protein
MRINDAHGTAARRAGRAMYGEHNHMRELRAELTVRGLILGVLITLVFTAANVYF